ncbi:MAG: 3-dehydroquinate synthase, partial [Pseudoflavonifractor sp.]
GSLRAAGFTAELITVPAGEQSKSVTMLETLYDAFADFGLTRTDAVAALGGGVVGDLAGFAAATFLRGVAFVQIPTTLLAQVDSSVGGKVAVDLKAGKNLAGAFLQPKLVLMDPAVLGTLDERAFADGMAEVIKYGCIADADFFSFLEQHPSPAELAPEIEYALYTCCTIKRDVVVKDEFDTGLRMLLNFGHTMGHAYEKAGGYRRWTHGQGVSAGMVRACALGVSLGITPPELPDRIAVLLANFGLPIAIPCTAEDYRAAIGLDKKGSGEDISLILLQALGQAVPLKLPKEKLLELLEQK